MTNPSVPSWVTTVPSSESVHDEPPRAYQWDNLSENELQSLRKRLLESILSAVTQALTGLFLPGPMGSAFDQLKAWADSVGADIDGVVDDVTELVDAILSSVGILPGSGDTADVTKLFENLLKMLGLPDLTSGSFSPSQAIKDFITDMLTPSNMLVPMNPLTGLLDALHVPNLDGSKIKSGTVESAYLPPTAWFSSIAASLISGTLVPGNIPKLLDQTWMPNASWGLSQLPSSLLTNLSNLDASKILSGFLDVARIQDNTLPQLKVAGLPADLLKLLPWTMFTTSQRSGANLLLDGGFENTALWANVFKSGTNSGLSTTRFRKGVQSFKLTGDGVQPYSQMGLNNDGTTTSQYVVGTGWQHISVKQGDVFALSGWFFIESANTAPGTSAGIAVRYKDSTGVNTTQLTALPAVATKGAWVQQTGNLTVPAGFDQMYVSAQISASATIPVADIAYLDDFSVIDITASQNVTDTVANALGSAGVGKTLAQLAAALGAIPGSNIGSVIGASIVPKTLDQSWMPNALWPLARLDAALLNTGSAIDASKLLSGFLDVARIQDNTLPQLKVTGLPTSLSALLPWTTFNTAQQGGSNLAFSPNFEDSTVVRSHFAGGTGGTFGYSMEQKRSGAQSYKWTVNTTGTWIGPDFQPTAQITNGLFRFTVKEGETYKASAWVYAHASNGTAGTVRIWMRWSAQGLNTVDAPQATGSTFQRTNLALVGAGWQELSNYGTCPAGKDCLEVMVLSDNTTPIGNAYYIDDIELREVSEAQNTNVKLFGGIGVPAATILSSVIQKNLDQSWMPNALWPIARLDTALLNTGSAIDASKLLSGFLDVARIQDATLPQGKVTGLGTALSSLLPITTFTTSQRSGTNLLLDSGFENTALWTTAWKNVPASGLSTTRAHKGIQSYKLVGDGVLTGSYVGLNNDGTTTGQYTAGTGCQHINVKQGDVFTTSLWAFIETANTAPTMTVSVVIRYRDSTGVNANQAVGLTGGVTTKGGWTQSTPVTFTVPAGYDQMFLAAQATSSAAIPATDIIYVDDCVLQEITAAQSVTDSIANALGSAGALKTLAQLTSALTAIPGANIGSTTGATVVWPTANLHTSVLNTGSSLDASKILSGDLDIARIPKLLDTSWITSGTFGPQQVGVRNYENLALGSDFETGTQPWPLSAGWSIVTTQSHTPTHSLQATGTGVATILMGGGPFTVRQGDQVYMEFWHRHDATWNGTSGTSKLRIGDQGGALLASAGFGVETYTVANTWVKTTFTYTVVAGVTALQFTLGSDQTAGNVWLDDIVISAGTVGGSRLFGLIPTSIVPKTLDQSWMPNALWPIARLDTALLNTGSAIDASKLLSGFLDVARIQDATLPQGKVTGLSGAISYFRSSAQAGANLLPDPGFENAVLWGPNGNLGTLSTEQAHSGATSLKMVATTGLVNTYLSRKDDGNNIAPIPVQPGERYYAEYWVYPHASNVDTSSGVMLAASFTDSKAVNPSQYLGLASLTTPTMVNGQWNKVSGYITVPAGLDRMNPYVYPDGTAAAGETFYFDDFIIREVTESQAITNRLFGGSNVLGTILSSVIQKNLDQTWMPLATWPIARLDSAVLNTGSSIDASKLLSGFLDVARIQDATLPQGKVSGLGTALSALLPITMFNQSGASGSNLVISPDFEDTTINRSVYMAAAGTVHSYSTEQKNSGTRSWKIVTNSNNDLVYLQHYSTPAPFGVPTVADALKVQPGQRFYLEVSYQSKAGNATGSTTIQLGADARDFAGVNATTYLIASGITVTVHGAWTKLSGYITVPAGRDRLIPWVAVQNATVGNSYYIDDAVVREATDTQLLTNQLFGGNNILSTVASAIVPKTLDQSWMPNALWPIARLDTALLNTGSAIDASKLLSGFLDVARIQDATLPQGKVTGLSSFLNWSKVGATSGSNLIPDPGLESTVPWIGSANGVQSTVQKHGGTYSRLITSQGAAQQTVLPLRDDTGAAYMIQCKPGERFYFECWTLPDSANVTPASDTIVLVLTVQDSMGVTAQTWTNIKTYTGLTVGTWTKLSGYYTVPAGYDRVMPYWQISAGATTAGNKFYVDDFVLREETDTQVLTNQLFGGSSVLSTIVAAAVPKTLDQSWMPNALWPIARLDTALLNTGSAIDASKLLSGFLDVARIQDATLPQGKVSGLGTALSALLPWTAFNTAQQGGSNLAYSPNFEDSTVVRANATTSGATYTYSTEQKRSGTQSYKWTVDVTGSFHGLRLTPTGQVTGNLLYFNVKEGETYKVGAWLYPHASNSTTGFVRIYMRWTNSVDYVDAVQATGCTFQRTNAAMVGGGWQEFNNIATCPAGRNMLSVFIANDNTTPVGNAYYVDDIEVREVTDSQLTNTKLFGGIGIPASTILNAAINKTLDQSWMPNALWPIARLDTAVLNTGSAIDASKLLSGFLDVARIQDATLPQGKVSGLGTALSSLLPITTFTTSQRDGSNLLVDGGFENTALWTNAWESVPASGLSTTRAHKGTQSYKIVGDGVALTSQVGLNNDGTLTGQYFANTGNQHISIKQGDTFTASLWAFIESANTSPAETVSVGVRYRDSLQVNGNQFTVLTGGVTTKGAWTQSTPVTFTVPTGYDQMFLYAVFASSAAIPATDIVYVDDCVLQEVTAAQSVTDSIANALGSAGSLKTLAQLTSALTAIPGANIGSAIGALMVPKTLDQSWMPNALWPIARLDTALLNTGSAIDASKILSGFLDIARIQDNTLPQGKVTGLPASLSSLLPWTMFSTSQRDGANMLLDGGFENTALWATTTKNGTNSGISTTRFHSGVQSYKLTGDGTNSYSHVVLNNDGTTTSPIFVSSGNQPIAVKQGDVLSISMWVYVEAANTAGAGWSMGAVLRVRDSTAVNAPILTGIASTTVKGAWTQVTGLYTVPAGYDQVILSAQYSTTAPVAVADIVYVDDAVLLDITASQKTTDTIANALGSAGANKTLAQLTAALTAIPGGNIGSAIGALMVPKTLDQSWMPNALWPIARLDTAVLNTGSAIDASKLLSGFLDVARIQDATLPQAKVTGLGTALTSLVPWATFNTASKGGTNLAYSPDFEDTTVPRTLFLAGATYGYSTEQKRSGLNSYKWTTVASNWGGIMFNATPQVSRFIVKEGETYKASAWVYAHASNNTTAGRIQLYMRWVTTATSAILDQSAAAAGCVNQRTNAAITGQGWLEYSNYGTCPAGKDALDVMILSENTTPAGNSYYVDDIELREVTDSQNTNVKLFGGLGSPLTTILNSAINKTLDQSWMPGAVWPISNLHTSVLNTASSIDASKLLTGFLDVARIQDATLPQGKVTGLGTDLAARVLNTAFLQKGASGNNLVISPDLEDSTVARSTFSPGSTWAYSTEQKNSGTQSLKVTIGTVNDGVYWQQAAATPNVNDYVKVVPGQRFYEEVWFYSKAGNAAGGSIALAAVFVDSAGVTANIYLAAQALTLTTTTGVWTKLSGYVTAPAGCNRMLPYTNFNSATVGNQYYLDDIVVREATDVQLLTNQLYGGNNPLATIAAAAVPKTLDSTWMPGAAWTQAQVTGLPTSLTNINNNIKTTRRSGANLVHNGDWEDVNNSVCTFVGPGVTYSTTKARSGTHSWAMKPTPPSTTTYVTFPTDPLATVANSNSWMPVNVQPGQIYKLSAWYLPDAANTSPANSITLQFIVTARDSSGVLADQSLTLSGPAAGGVSAIILPNAATGVWAQLLANVTIPAGYDRLMPYILLSPSATSVATDTIYLDDVGIYDVTGEQKLADSIASALGGSSTLNPLSNIIAKLQAIPGANIGSATGATVVWPTANLHTSVLNTASALDATKILSGLIDIARHPVSVQNSVTTVGEMETIFGSVPTVPTTSTGTTINNWWNDFFTGGPKNVVSNYQIADTSGIAPLDAGKKVLWENLPSALMSVASVSYCVLSLPANQSIANSTEAQLTGFNQLGPVTVTYTGNDFKLPYDGYWDIEVTTVWGASGTNQRETALKKNGTIIRADGISANAYNFYPPRNNFSTRVNVLSTDLFGVWVRQNSGAALGVQTAGTYIQATYIGPSTAPANTLFDAAGGGDFGAGSSKSWNQVFGPNANTIVVSCSHTGNSSSAPPTAVVGGAGGPYTVPLLSGPTYVGNYFGYQAYHSFFAAILPTSVRSSTRTVTVTFPSTAAAGAQSTTFSNVASLGNVVVSAGNSAPSLYVPSNSASMVAIGFGGMDVNFSAFSHTVDQNVAFNAYVTWAHLMGHGPGGTTFTANGGKWSGKGIELHN